MCLHEGEHSDYMRTREVRIGDAASRVQLREACREVDCTVVRVGR
jgi:hypothetical protein